MQFQNLLSRWITAGEEAEERGQPPGRTVYDLVDNFLFLAGAVIAICVMSFFVDWPQHSTPKANQSPAVATLPQRIGEPKNPAPQVHNAPVPRDQVSLAREIQRELKRVGCYDGELNGIWNAQSRSAMKKFADQVNAKLPIDRPDFILLRLAQNHQGRACGSAGPKTLPPPSLLYEGRLSPANPRAN